MNLKFHKNQNKSLIQTLVLVFCFLNSSLSWAALDLSSSLFGNAAALQAESAMLSLFEVIGYGMDIRPMEGIHPPSGPFKLDLTTNISIATFPHSFTQTLADAGYTELPVNMIPSIQIHLSRAMSPRLGVDFGYFKFSDYSLIGGSAKLLLYDPEEGPGIAIRVSYQKNHIMIVDTSTWSYQLMIGKRLDFAETYLGIAAQKMSGELNLALPSPIGDVRLTASGGGYNIYAFTGVIMEIPIIGILFGIEGSYAHRGTSTLQTKIGLRF